MKNFTLRDKENFDGMPLRIDRFVTTRIDEIKNTTYINLFTTNDCQNDCWYCVENIPNKNHNEKVSTETFNNILKFIDSQNTKNVHFHFYGGEPSTHRQLKPFIRKLRKKFGTNIEIIVSTNLMKTLNYYKSFPEYVKFICSMHTEYIKNYNTWLNTAISLYKREQIEKIILMLTKDNMDDVIRIYNEYSDTIHMEIEPIDQFRFTEDYKNFYDAYEYNEKYEYGNNPKVYDIIINGKRHQRTPDFRGFGNFKGCFCNAGFDITTDGDVFKCMAKNQEALFNVNDIVLEHHLVREKWNICKDVDCPSTEFFSRVSEIEFVRLKKQEDCKHKWIKQGKMFHNIRTCKICDKEERF